MEQQQQEEIKITKLNTIPSSNEFISKIEPRNVPADWKAFDKWNPSTGGLDYLQFNNWTNIRFNCVSIENVVDGLCTMFGRLAVRIQLMELAGSSTVEVMLSRSAPVFYGDIRNHERVPLPFSSFIGYCKGVSLQNKESHAPCSSTEKLLPASIEAEQDDLLVGEAPHQIYLAQVPIMNMEKEEKVQLGGLIEDIQTPQFLETKTLASINLWMNGAQTRSSTHYDPHHNLLCVVSGSKQVDLWPPSSSPVLYPMPLYGEASNHSAVPIDEIDLSLHPRAEHSKKYSQRVILHAGDALFIPEGWFHQVDSESLTVAVNFWWRSEMMSGMSEHMDSYYLRRILKRLTDKEMNQMLSKTSLGASNKPSYEQSDEHGCNVVANNIKVSGGNKLHDLEPYALKSLHELVSLVHDRVNAADLSNQKPEPGRVKISELYYLEEDPVATIFWDLDPLTLQKMFLAMVQHFPRTLEGLLLHLVSPVGAEVLTRKFDEMDQLIAEQDRNEFYQAFYSVFDDEFAVMDTLLNGKESFSRQAFKNVMDKFLGVKVH
ncbi:2-oxoglutarate (2OG) and Fe(II)-dependent oxygenase superfamily protein [Artemisia annua]|uniref:2-oxoglutarate (2OG) and Fe(II)-dependent oxygenase superfamily protein n=1 Tax=Artemisia annua TaxID=35608 RepID=A0A2U1MNN3_ARTAN|nr:2-oxoglutarate (2OG) and Fe(II)-dependent oxygenase superfamily protein [Artemisia annua]